MPEMIALCGAAKFRPVRDPDAYVRRVSRALGSDLSITPTLRGDGRAESSAVAIVAAGASQRTITTSP
jgi:hypothetical protein